MDSSPAGPLSGIRVLDLGHYIAGPLTAMLLADQGAEVIKIDPPGALSWASPVTETLNRGKSGIHLDLKSKRGIREIKKLILNSDVLIENFRPGVMQNLGLGPDDCTLLNPELIYLALPGFSSDDHRSHIQAWEGVIAAATGLYTDLSLTQKYFGRPPIYTALTMASTYGAIHAAISVVMALIAREDGKGGAAIEVPLSDAVASSLGVLFLNVEKMPSRYKGPIPDKVVEGVLAQARRDGELGQIAKLVKEWESPMGDIAYVCADERLLLVVANAHVTHCVRLFEVLGLWEELLEEGLVKDNPYKADYRDNNVFRCASTLSLRWRQKIRDKLVKRFRSRPADGWENLLGAAGIPCAVQRTTSEWIKRDEIRSAGLVSEMHSSKYGAMTQLGQQVWFDDIGVNRKFQENVVSSAAAVQDLFSKTSVTGIVDSQSGDKKSGLSGQSLDEITVLDLSNVIGGPVAGRTMAEFGARVIKVDSPYPGHYPEVTCYYALDVGRGKESILIDLKKSSGKKIFEELVGRADVVLFNSTDESARRLKITHEDLSKLNPEIITCQLSALGAPRRWRRSDHPGYDEIAQAQSGIMLRYGSVQQPQEHSDASCVDYLTGFSGAFGMALALFRKKTTGKISHVETSLAMGAQLAQIALFWDYKGRSDWDEPSGQFSKGVDLFYRLYETKNGWIFVGLKKSDIPALLKMDEFASLNRSDFDAELQSVEKRLSKIFKSKGCDYWEAKFWKIGLGLHRVTSIDEIRKAKLANRKSTNSNPSLKESISMSTTEYEGIGNIAVVDPTWVRSGSNGVRRLVPAPTFGKQTRNVLRELGYSQSHIDELFQDKVVADSWPHGNRMLPV